MENQGPGSRAPLPGNSGLEPALGKGTGVPVSRPRQIPVGRAREVPQGSLRAADPCKSSRRVQGAQASADAWSWGFLVFRSRDFRVAVFRGRGGGADSLVPDSLHLSGWHTCRERYSPPPSCWSLSPGGVTWYRESASFWNNEVGLRGFQP